MSKLVSRKPELLAPAGNLETALAAYDAGADAVYGGLTRFNARERAANFSATDLARLLDYAHARGRKFYLTFNTLLKETEIDEAAGFLSELVDLKPDALIVQDLALIELVRRYFPSLVLHASTQMGIHNSAGVVAAARLGISRVILERQITLEELAAIAATAPIELEVFVHGSLCCSLSGQCLLSSALGGWSGNRGKCKQPCRRRYRTASGEGFWLSPRDLDATSLIPQFRQLGIASLKIEGRLRGPDYVWKTVRAYRLLLDAPDNPPAGVREEAAQLLRSTASRKPSTGFYTVRGARELIDAGRLGVFGCSVGRVVKCVRTGIMVHTEERLHLGDRLRLVPPDGGEGEAFTLIALECGRHPVVKVRPGTECFLPGDFTATPGFLLYKIGENGFDFSRQASALPAGRRPLTLKLHLSARRWSGEIAELPGERWQCEVDFAPANTRPFDRADAVREFAAAVPEPWAAGEVAVELEDAFFVPASRLKALRREFWNWAAERLAAAELPAAGKVALERFHQDRRAAGDGKRPNPPPREAAPQLTIPGFLPEGKLPEWKKRIAEAYAAGIRIFRVEGLHGFELLRGCDDITITTGFPLAVTNAPAAGLLESLGATLSEPSPELDRAALEVLEKSSPLPLKRRTAPVPLLVTRAGMPPAGEWDDGRGNHFRLTSPDEMGISRLFAVDTSPSTPPDVPPALLPFYLNDWK